MRVAVVLFLLFHFLAAYNCWAQTVLQGDSSYLGLRTFKDSMSVVVAQLGQHYHQKELLSWYHANFRNGRNESGTRVDSYALRYHKLGAAFCVINNEKGLLYQIRFYPSAAIVSARGIQPGISTFSEVIAQYGPSQRYNSLGQQNQEPATQPRVYQYSQDHKIWYTMLRYRHIAFVSKGKVRLGENLLSRPVQEIWLW